MTPSLAIVRFAAGDYRAFTRACSIVAEVVGRGASRRDAEERSATQPSLPKPSTSTPGTPEADGAVAACRRRGFDCPRRLRRAFAELDATMVIVVTSRPVFPSRRSPADAATFAARLRSSP